MPQNILQGVVALYRALYRKWRPRKFADVVGQEAIVTALQNQIAAGRIGHAYLFTGTRGTGNIIEFDVDELILGYRKSRIADDGFIVLSATFNLAPGNAAMIKADMDNYRQRREDKQPLDMPSAGSPFKRPEGYFAGKLIMDAGLRGHAVGGAQVSEKHCGFIVNADHATAADVDELIRHIQATVKEQFDVDLEPEVHRVGEFL